MFVSWVYISWCLFLKTCLIDIRTVHFKCNSQSVFSHGCIFIHSGGVTLSFRCLLEESWAQQKVSFTRWMKRLLHLCVIMFILNSSSLPAYTEFNNGNWNFPFNSIGEMKNLILVLTLQTSASLKFTVLNPKGRIWTMVAGGGASVIYADTVRAPIIIPSSSPAIPMIS